MMQWIVSSSVLIAAVIALRYLLRGRISLHTQYALWLLVLVRLLVPVSFGASELSVMNAVPERAPVVLENRVQPTQTEQENHFTGIEATAPTVPVTPTAPADSALVPSVPTETEEPLDRAELARTVWLLGAAAVGLAFLAVNLRFRGKLRRSRETVEQTGAALPVYATAAVETPCLFGLVRPAIYLTPATAADGETLRYALAHEQMHYRHGDHLWSALRCACLALHWYNPLVWWAAELSRRDAELACDEATVRVLGESERAAYGRTLIRMTCEKRPALLLTATTMTDNGKGLRERITLLVKKPKTAVYTAVAIVLVALLAVVCTFTGREAELADPFGKTYPAVEMVYAAPEYSYSFTEGTMPSIQMEQSRVKLIYVRDNGYQYAAPEELTLTAENFDALFRDASDGTSGWTDGMSAGKLRRENARAWSCRVNPDENWQADLLYILQQKDGTLYLAFGFDQGESGASYIRWLMRLGDAEDSTALEMWDSMEAYVLSRINALKEPDGFSYYIIPEDGGDGMPIEVTETVVDVRVITLEQVATCEGLSPDGTLELWYFEYEVKPEDKAGALPDRFLWVGGNAITDDGYILEGWPEYLTVLHRADGSYQILAATRSNDGLWYDGNGYDSGSEYLYDFYIDYAELDLPRYYHDKHGWHRFDGDGWYIYIAGSWERTTNAGEDCWYSGYLTGSTLRVNKYPDSVAAMEELYRTNGFTLEQAENTTLSGPWCRYDAPSGTQYENYLAPAEDGGCYLISTYWWPKGANTVGTWGEGEQEAFVELEAKALRAMAKTFAVGRSGTAGSAESANGVLTLTGGETVAAQLCSGEGWYLYAPTDWVYEPLTKTWTAPDEASQAHFSLIEATASMENVKAYNASIGAWSFETDMAAPLDYYYNLTGGYDAADGYAHEELYFVPLDESRSYVLCCYSVNGTTPARDKSILRAMAQSFTVADGVAVSDTGALSPNFESDLEKLDTVKDFASHLVLSKDGETLGAYDVSLAWNTPRLNSYTFVSTTAPVTDGKMILELWLSNNDSSLFEFYEGTNTVGYIRGSGREYYKVSDDFAVGDGVGLYDVIRGWYDEAELTALRLALEETPIPDRGQTWEEAAQEWIDAYEGIHLAVTTGSEYKYTWIKNAVEPAEDITQFWREKMYIDEDGWCFYTKTAFVAESDRALNRAMAGNTGPCTIDDTPEGAYEYYHCCSIRRTADGWVGTMYGTGW